MSEEFIGSGWAFPLAADATGAIALVSREEEIKQSVQLILGTSPGERPMRPDFGCRINDYIFSPADAETASRIAADVRIALERWEPRIELESVTVTSDPEDEAVLYINVGYTISSSNDPRNLVFPFYVIPAEEPVQQLAVGAA